MNLKKKLIKLYEYCDKQWLTCENKDADYWSNLTQDIRDAIITVERREHGIN